jgi:lipopolysaccharide/colanic/teichoic acid biosynthesis glycosyltransferase
MQLLARSGSIAAPRSPVEPGASVPQEAELGTTPQHDHGTAADVQVDESELRQLVRQADRDDHVNTMMTRADVLDGVRADAIGIPRPSAPHDAIMHGGPVPCTLLGRRVKRGIDIAGSVTLLAALSPVLATCAAVVRLGSPGPILFRQKRIGQNGQPFIMLKFRTMHVNADQTIHEQYVKKYIAGGANAHDADGATVFKLVGDARVTRAGRWLRRMSLDELPQLINVLRGEMSLVGPRPPLPYEVEHYRPRDLQRLRAKPGITGLWQVNGRNKTTFDQMIDLDLTYLRRWSIVLDLRILQRTIPVVLFPDGY